MPPVRKTNLINYPRPITSELSALFETIRTNRDAKIRKDAVTHLLKLADEDKEIDIRMLKDIYAFEKDIRIAAELKRVLNKLTIKETLSDDPTSKYDKKLSSEEETKVIEEIERLRKLYDKSSKEKGAFDKKYKIVQKIAEGGMGKIYKGIRLQDNQTVAIKFLLLEELSGDNDPERIIARFKREGEILKRLSHPNIIKGFEYGEADGEYFLVMEYVEGEALEDRLKRSPLDLQAFRIMCLQLCNAVEYLHKNGIMHRDIKPGNILIHEENHNIRIKLCDFGLAKDKRDKKLSKFAFSAGTDDYISPQQAKDARDADERDDIYSMGKTFYEMLTGRTLRNDESYVELNVGDETISRKLNDVIRKCMSFERKDRWQTVKELKSVLERAVGV